LNQKAVSQTKIILFSNLVDFTRLILPNFPFSFSGWSYC